MEQVDPFNEQWLQALEAIRRERQPGERFVYFVEARDGEGRASKVRVVARDTRLSSIYYPTRSDWIAALRQDLKAGVFD